MENSWQSKCGSLWQKSHPPPPPLVPSSLLDSQTQFSSADRHLYLQLAQEPMSTGGMIQDHMFPHTHGLDNLGNADLGPSFLSLISGPSGHVPFDEQHLVDPKPVPVSNLVLGNRRTANGFAGGSGVSALPTALRLHMDCPNLTSAEVLHPLTSSFANVNSSSSSAVLPAAILNFQKSQAIACQNTDERDKLKSFSSLIGNNNASPVSSNSWKSQKYAHITSLQKSPVESNVSAYRHVYNPSSSFPRVFCSGISGNLLLSDTGLLGVVCACHGLYMSIAKFSEHSGSCDVNPGDAIHMDNGETVAHWWKTFSKTGIRVLEGHRGWDWPEGSAASGLSNHPMSSTSNDLSNHPIFSTSNNPVLLTQACPSMASVSYEQQKFSVINSKENQSCRNIVDRNLCHERERTSQECNKSIFRYFMNSSHGNLQHGAGQHMYGLPNSCVLHTGKASESTTAKLDPICESANSLPVLPNVQDLKTPSDGFSVGRKTSFILEKQGASSNFELRLGQPSEQRQTLGTKAQPASGSDLIGMHVHPSKVFVLDKLLQRSNELQGSGWSPQYADVASNLPERRGSTQLEHLRNVGGDVDAITDYWKDSSNIGLEMTNINSLLSSCFKSPERKWQFRNIYDNNRDSHASEKLPYESHDSRNEKICLPWSSVAGNIKEFSTKLSNARMNVNKGKEVECAPNGLFGAAKSTIDFSKAFKEDLSCFNLVLGGSSSNCWPAFHEKCLNSHQMSAMAVDESCGGDILNNCWKISSLSDIMHFNHDHVKSTPNSVVSNEKMPVVFSPESSVSVQSATPILSKENFSGIKKDFQYQNVEIFPVLNMLELSNRDNGPASVGSVQECEIIKNPCVQSLLTIAPLISKDHTHLLDSSKLPKIPEIGEKSTWMGHNSERFGALTGRSSRTEDPNLPPLEQLLVRPWGTECNFTYSMREHCFQGLPYAYGPEMCSSAAQENLLAGQCDLNGDNCCNLVKGGDISGAGTSLLHSKLKENYILLKETAKSFEKNESLDVPNFKNAESHSFQRRGVPQKIMESCSSTCKEQQAGRYNQSLGSCAADVAKCFSGFAQNVVTLKEQEISNISSGCSAPDVTQSSIEVNKKDSSTIEGGNIRCANNLVLDEGSGNDRSWSSDDALDNDFVAEFSGSASGINLIKREPLKVVPRKRSLSLIEEIRIQNSLQSKNSQYKFKRSSTIQEDSNHLQKFELGPKKRRKAVKWMKLDVSVPVSGQSSINIRSSKCTEGGGQNAHSFWEMQTQVGCDQGCPRNCADSVEQSVKQRNSAFSAVKGISRRRDFQKVYHQGEQQTSEAHKSSVVDDTLEGSEIFRKKRLTLDDAPDVCKEIREICCSSAELTAKLTSLGCHSNCLGKPNFYKWMTRPTVFGKYGIISNGNPSKPTKIVPLRKIFKTAASHADKTSRNAGDDEKPKSVSVKVKKTSVGFVKETAFDKKIFKSQVKKGETRNMQPIEQESYDQNGEIETASCSGTSGSDDVSYTLQKCNNHMESKHGVHLKTKFKESRKRSIHELLTEGNAFKVVNSSVKENSFSLCQTTSRCCGDLMAKAVHGRAQTTEMNTFMRCSEKHQPKNSDMFCCVCGGSEKDKNNQLLQCNRFLIKGLRDEAEAVDNENVCFNGKCMPRATSHIIIPDANSERLQPGEKFLTCARTEGYKGRKREGFLHNHPQDTVGSGGCLVPQEQLNAWLHIHRQKPQRTGHPKLSSSSVESDCRKAYARYKQSKSWKHLVVYKSGIHALGLYTSQFISRGAMVVEYVGEIVGLRVADRRESEYHSGKKLQHKSACYFFRIDKEHIIDATRKGGIARFVNHSCQPNCVAKVISVRTEKKVVFFAERDIYPGEEITYDYHFNHEDEGEKIPCYCNSKNCRRYLN